MSKGHAVVDGSNIATEGRSTPSLSQLDEAVTTFMEQYDFEYVTVIVDATFEHRVEDPEREAAKAAIEGAEIFTPPAGVIGRGDAFILQVADKANAVVLSNDSFQEFHGTYDWLFDDARLIGGKPIPGVGWIFVPRSPVRGPVSRRAMRQSTVTEPAPPGEEVGGPRRATKSVKKAKSAKITKTVKNVKKSPAKTAAKPSTAAAARASKRTSTTNSAAAWRSFRKDYPEGSTVAAKVDKFSSHGAYGSVDGVSVYIPLSLLADPAPRRARDVISLGETRNFVVCDFDEIRRSIDVGLVRIADDAPAAAKKPTTGNSTAKKTTKKKTTTPKKTATRKSTTKATPSANKATTRKTAAKKAPAKKAAAKKTAAKKATTRTTPSANKATTRKTAAKKAPAKKAAAKKTAAKKATTKKPAARKSATK